METHYDQFCPIAKASEVFATRWTPLILRELMADIHGFNDIHRGVAADLARRADGAPARARGSRHHRAARPLLNGSGPRILAHARRQCVSLRGRRARPVGARCMPATASSRAISIRAF